MIESQSAKRLKSILQEQTKKALEDKVFKGHNPFPDVGLNTDAVILNVKTLEAEYGPKTYRALHLVLKNDGRLYKLEIIGEYEGSGEWDNHGTLREEAEDDYYTEEQIDKIQKLLTNSL